MRARHFVIGVVVGMVGLAASWFLAVDHWLAVSPPPVSWSYKQFLLENVPAPRLIIVAGSNAHYSIDPAVLERRYRVPVINLADNGSYPLTHKLYNLLRYARSGDLVIMPLEWSQYALPGPLSAEYVEARRCLTPAMPFIMQRCRGSSGCNWRFTICRYRYCRPSWPIAGLAAGRLIGRTCCSGCAMPATH